MVKFKKKPKKLPKSFSEGDELEVKCIHDDDYKYQQQWYLVEWKGWPSKRDWTWQTRTDLLPGSTQILETYEDAHGIVDGKGQKKKSKSKMTR